MADFTFSPEPIQAKVGDIIEWTNNGPSDHNPTLDGSAVCMIGDIPTGGVSSAGMTFSAAGTYPYHCEIHPSMKGTIVVSP